MRLPFAVLGYAHDRDDIQAVIDACTAIGLHQIRKGYCPPIWDSRVRYQREVHPTLPGVERINTAEESHALGADDCDGLAPYAAASYQSVGVDARAVVLDSPGIGYHVVCVIRDRDGRERIYDPSAERGMLDRPVGAARSEVATRRRRATAALARVRRISADLARLNPASRAARALTEEALRNVRVARTETEAADEIEDENDDAD